MVRPKVNRIRSSRMVRPKVNRTLSRPMVSRPQRQ